jgi:hypothetical protein
VCLLAPRTTAHPRAPQAKKLADRLHLEQSAAKSKVAASSQRPAAGQVRFFMLISSSIAQRLTRCSQDERHKIEEDLCIVRKELVRRRCVLY